MNDARPISAFYYFESPPKEEAEKRETDKRTHCSVVDQKQKPDFLVGLCALGEGQRRSAKEEKIEGMG